MALKKAARTAAGGFFRRAYSKFSAEGKQELLPSALSVPKERTKQNTP